MKINFFRKKNIFKKSFFQSNAGFNLLEVIIAITVITIGLLGAFTLANKTISSGKISANRVTAASLSQEGIEIVRNIRDSNWLAGNPWNQGLAAGDYIVQYDDTSLRAFSNTFLKIDSNNFFVYDSGNDTVFKRKITITNNPDGDAGTEDIGVRSEITWTERGRSHSLSAEDRLYNWAR